MLDHLKAKRSELQARSVALGTSIAKLTSLQDRVAKAETALREHDQDAAEAMHQWAIDGGEGDPPAGDHQVRSDLLRDVAKAQANLQHAGVAHAQLTGEARDVAIEMSSVGAKIELAVIEALIEERDSEVLAFDTFVEREVRPKLARLAALHTMIVEKGNMHWNAGRTDQGRALLARAERINVRPEIDYPAQGAIVAAASKWATRFGELMGEPVAALEPEPERVRTIVPTNGGGVRLNNPDPELVEAPRLAIVGGAVS